MEIKRCGDDVVDYKIDICDPYSFRKLKQDVFSSYRNKRNAGFDISNVYEDFGEMLVMGVNTLVLDYYYLISELSKKFKVIMLGEDFGLSSVSYLLGLSTYNSGQLKTNIEYGQFWPSRLSFGIDRSKASDFEEAIRAFDTDEHGNLPGVNEQYGEDSNRVDTRKRGQRPVTIKVRYIDTKRFRLLTDNEPDYSALPFPKIAADTLYDLLDGKTECYRIGEKSAELIEPLLTMFKPESFKGLEQVCALLLIFFSEDPVAVSRCSCTQK